MIGNMITPKSLRYNIVIEPDIFNMQTIIGDYNNLVEAALNTTNTHDICKIYYIRPTSANTYPIETLTMGDLVL